MEVHVLDVREQRRGLLHAGADERVGDLRPGEGGAHVSGRGPGKPGQRAHRGRAGRDRARHRPDRVEAGCEREDAVGGDQAPRRLEADDAAAGGGEADRARAVRPERDLAEARGEGGAVPAARPARDPARVERVDDGAEVRVVRGDAVGELVQVRLAHDRVARRLELRHARRRTLRHVVAVDRRPVGRDEPRRVDQVLDGERDPVRPLLRNREERPVRVRRLRRRSPRRRTSRRGGRARSRAGSARA